MDAPFVCVLCGGEIPAGWPAVLVQGGIAHRFSTMCERINPGCTKPVSNVGEEDE